MDETKIIILVIDHHCWSSLHTVHHATTQALVRLPMHREHLLLLSNTVSTVNNKDSGQANHVSKTLLLKTFYCQQLYCLVELLQEKF